MESVQATQQSPLSLQKNLSNTTTQGQKPQVPALALAYQSSSMLQLICTNCNESFDLKDYTPYVLPCSHTVCKQCLKAQTKEKSSFTCQYDNTVVNKDQIVKLQKSADVINRLKNKKLHQSPSSQNLFPLKIRMDTMKSQKIRDEQESQIDQQQDNADQFRQNSYGTQSLLNFQQQNSVLTQFMPVTGVQGGTAIQPQQQLEQEETPQMSQIKMDFNSNIQTSLNTTPTPNHIMTINLTEEEKNIILAENTPKQVIDNKQTNSLHTNFKNPALMKSTNNYKIIDELIEEESKSSIYNKTNMGDDSRRQSYIQNNNVFTMAKGTLMSIQDQDNNQQRDSPLNIQDNNNNNFNYYQQQIEQAQDKIPTNQKLSSQRQSIHQEDDIDRNEVIEANRNLIDKNEQKLNDQNQLTQSQSNLHTQNNQTNNIEYINLPNFENIPNNVVISRNEQEMNLISRTTNGSNKNLPMKFTIEIEHVSLVDSPSQQQNQNNQNQFNQIDQQQQQQFVNSHNTTTLIPQLQGSNDNNLMLNLINDGTESLVTDAMFKNSFTPSNNDQLLYQNSIGNLTLKTVSEYQTALNFQSKKDNQDAFSKPLPYLNQIFGQNKDIQSNTHVIEQIQLQKPPEEYLQSQFVKSVILSPNLDIQDKQEERQAHIDQPQKSHNVYYDDQNLPQVEPSSTIFSQTINDIDEKFNQEKQLSQIQQQYPNGHDQNQAQQFSQIQNAQHDFLQQKIDQQNNDQAFLKQKIQLIQNQEEIQKIPIQNIIDQVDTQNNNNQGTMNSQDFNKKKKKKGKKKKKKGVNMTSIVDESQYEYTMVQDDVSSEHNIGSKSRKSLKNIIAQGNQDFSQLTQVQQNPQQNKQVSDQPKLIQNNIIKQAQYDNEQLNNKMTSLQSFDAQRENSQMSIINLQNELKLIEKTIQNNQNQNNLTYIPPHLKLKKFRQNKVVSQEFNSPNRVDPQMVLYNPMNNIKMDSILPSSKDSIHSQTQQHLQQNITQQTINIQNNKGLILNPLQIQDGKPHFNTSMGIKQGFQQKNSLTNLPDINVRDNSLSKTRVIEQLQTVIQQDNIIQQSPIKDLQVQIMNKSLQPQNIYEEEKQESSINQNLQGNISLSNNGVNQNYINQQQNFNYDQFDNMHNSDYQIDTNYQNSPLYTIKQKEILDNENVNKFDSLHENFVSSPNSRGTNQLSGRNLTQNVNNFDQQATQVPNQSGIIMPLQDQCKYHPKETIKYFCRDVNCLKGLCPDCIIEHSKHDFLAASELAAFEIKQIAKQAQRRCKNQVKLQKELKQQTEKKLSQLNRQRNEEFQRLHCYFNELHKELEERENQLNQQFNEEIRDTESQLMKDMQNIQQIYSENVKIFKRLKMLIEQQQISTDTAIVGNAEIAYSLNTLTMKREQQNQTKLYFVQFEDNQHEIIMPSFDFDLSKEKEKIQSIGSLLKTNEENSNTCKVLQIQPQRVTDSYSSLEQAQTLIDNLQKYNSNPLPVSNIRKSLQQSLREVQTQTLELSNQQNKSLIIGHSHQNSEILRNDNDQLHTSNKNIHWFRWDSTEVYKLSPDLKQWQLRQDVRNSSKFLFFSSIVHLQNDMGCFIIGGSDNENNFSKRVQYFCKYNVFVEKPPMINKRAFFPSIFSKLDNSIYVLGGSENNQSDLNQCEKFSLIENVWRPIAPMNLNRNGMGAIIIEQYRLIFTFGGNNHQIGSLNQIEKYEIDFDKWSILSIQMRHSIHDLSAFCLGKERVLLFGGHSNTEPNKEVEMIDLSFECFKSKQGRSNFKMKEGGKTYFPPFYDIQTGKIQLLFGYCDTQPHVEDIDVSDLVLGNANFQQNNNRALGYMERKSQSQTRFGKQQLIEI